MGHDSEQIAAQLRTELARANELLDREIAERRRLEEVLRTSTVNYRLVAQSASDGIITIDANDRMIFVNPAASQMFGYAEDELLGRAVESVLVDLPKVAAEAASEQRVVELRGIRRDGGEIPVEVSFGNLSLDGGAKCTAFLRDITERKKIDKLKTELLSTVSHELRTPLTSLRGFVELILNRDYSPMKQRELLTIVHKETIRLTNLINDFLDIQRIESGRKVCSITCVDLRTAANETAALFASDDLLHTIACKIPKDLPFVMGDVDRVRQVLSNLLSNAIKFSPPGGEIVIEAQAGPTAVSVSIVDRGTGIPPDAVPNLFTKFFRVDNRETRSVGGSGLGLALVKELVEAQDGRVWVSTALGKGSRFSFSLPRAQEKDLKTRDPLPGPADGIDVLVVEDDEAYARLLGEHFREAGCKTAQTRFGEEAIILTRDLSPRVVLLDIHLGGTMDGWDVLLSLKRDPVLRDVPVILTTLSEADVHGLALDGADYLAKPVGVEALESAVRRVLGDRKHRRVLIADDDPMFRHQTVEALQTIEHVEIKYAKTGRQTLALVHSWLPDLLLLDLSMPELDGFEVLARLRVDKRAFRMAVIVVTGRDLDPNDKATITKSLACLMHKNAVGTGSLPLVVEHALSLVPSRAGVA